MNTKEAKIFGIDPKKVENHLLSLGATKVFTGKCTSIYFNHNMKENNRCLRLSQDNGAISLTFKGKEKGELDLFYYNTIKVSSLEHTKQLLESLGFIPDLFLHKNRTTFMLKSVKYDVDKYLGSFDHVPILLEIKAKDIASLQKSVTLMGFSKDQCTDWDLQKIDEHFSKE
jgi:predicted adenylyl cyclase CyaB